METGYKVAIKRIPNVFSYEPDTVRLIRELQILVQLNSEFTVKLLDIVIPDGLDTFDTIYLVMELCESDMQCMASSEMYLRNK